MRRALELAELGRGTTDPNPLVGCVLVRDGEVVGEGWHERAGGPHAEVAALAAAGADAAGATAYVTLEPCSHQGRTGPCCPALVEAGVRRVVYAVDDPDPQAGGGADALRAAGIEVASGLLASEAERQNEEFLLVRREGRPFVTLKLAQSLDGRVAAAGRAGHWITSAVARTRVHELRGLADAVMVGSGTVLSDDPRLDVRHLEPPRGQPRPVVLDRRGRIQAGATVVRDGCIVVTSQAAPSTWRDSIVSAGAEVIAVEPSQDPAVEMRAVLGALLDRGVRTVLCEGGPTLAGSIVQAGLVDRLVLHVAPILLGDGGLASVVGIEVPTVDAAPRWELGSSTARGPDLELVLRPVRDGG